ncbi:MAG: hypothetical protein GY822_25245 [Deltaproteobacteria bacterium]|nr:hypothetical protein [Deltaproteobacteria bacterium]
MSEQEAQQESSGPNEISTFGISKEQRRRGLQAFRFLVLSFALGMAMVFGFQVQRHARESRVFDVATRRFATVQSVQRVRVPCEEGSCEVMRVTAKLETNDEVKTPKTEKGIQVDYLAGNRFIGFTALEKAIAPGRKIKVPVVKNAKGHLEVVSAYFPERAFPLAMLLCCSWFLAFWAVLAFFSKRGLESHFPGFLTQSDDRHAR